MNQYSKVTHDSLRTIDQLAVNGVQVAGGDPHEIIGEVEVIYRSKRGNRTVFTKTLRRNDLLVTGAVFLSEKASNVRSSYVPGPLDLSLPDYPTLHTHTSDQITPSDPTTIPDERICGIMVGRNGCGETYNQVHRVYRTDRAVPGMVPFRTVPIGEDLAGEDRKKYFLRVVDDNYVYYYGKRFSESREINVNWEDGSIVDASTLVPGNDRGKLVKTFTKFTVSIEAEDIREYCRIKEGTTIRSLVNSVGLLTGYPMKAEDQEEEPSDMSPDANDVLEFGNVRSMTTLNTEDYPLKDAESTMDITYRLYYV